MWPRTPKPTAGLSMCGNGSGRHGSWPRHGLGESRALLCHCPLCAGPRLRPSLCWGSRQPRPAGARPSQAVCRSQLHFPCRVPRSSCCCLQPRATSQRAVRTPRWTRPVFLDHVLDFLKSEEDPPSLADSSDISSLSDSSSSSGESSVGEETPSTAARAGRAPSRSTGKLTAS